MENTFKNEDCNYNNGRCDAGGGIAQISTANVTFFEASLKQLRGLAHVVASVISVAAAASYDN